MTIDERIEAIAQHVELLGRMQIKTEEELQKTNRGLNRLRKYALLIASDHGSPHRRFGSGSSRRR
jgi:hypothetical protein